MIDWLFRSHGEHLDTRIPDGYADAIIVQTDIQLSFRDWLFLIRTRQLSVRTVVFTEHLPGKTRAKTLISQ